MEVNWKEYDNIIIELINEGLSYEKIGNKLDIYREKIRKRCIFLNIKSKYYEKKKKYCLECNKEIEGDKRKIFCGSSCSSIHNHKKRGFIKKDNECLICKNKIGQKSRFCSNTCYSESNYIEYIKKWKKGEETGISGEDGIRTHIRRYLFKKYNSKCCECGWNEINKKNWENTFASRTHRWKL
jgi:predicted nucleic acid-binding Zn ribbon protein